MAALARQQRVRATGATGTRLQLRQALAELQSPDLASQAQFTVMALLQDADAGVLEFFLAEALRPADCPPSARRLRYKLAANALRTHTPPDWGSSLLHVRDQLVNRAGAEDSSAAAVELQAVAQQLTAAFVEAYSRGQYASLGFASKAEVPRDWLSGLLITPLLRAACRGPARSRATIGCLLVTGVLLQCRLWAKSASVVHAAVDCLKQMLKLTSSGALPLSAAEVLLPLQSCVALLGPRLKDAALGGILQLCVQAMGRSEWQVRKAAVDILLVLLETLAAEPAAAQAAAGAAEAAATGADAQPPEQQQQQQQQQQGAAALVNIAPAIAAAVEQHVRYDRVPQVRKAAAVALRQLHCLPSLQEQRAPARQPVAGIRTRLTQPAAAGMPAAQAAAAAAAQAINGGVQVKGGDQSLQAVIADRRQQLNAAVDWRTAAAAVKVHSSPAGGIGTTVGGQLADSPGQASSTGSVDGDGWAAPNDRIRAWAGAPESPPQQSPQQLRQQPQPLPKQQQEAIVSAGCPPAARFLRAAQAALNRLQPPEQQADLDARLAGPRLRRAWGSQPSSPAKLGSHDLQAAPLVLGGTAGAVPSGWILGPAAGCLPASAAPHVSPPSRPDGPAGAPMPQHQAPQHQRQLWRQNPLAQSLEGEEEEGEEEMAAVFSRPAAGAAAAAAIEAEAAAVMPCVVFNIERPEFSLRLRSTPAEADLHLPSSSSGKLRSVRFWTAASQAGAEVGVQFELPGGGRHQYWLRGGQLHQEHGDASSAAEAGAPQQASEDAAATADDAAATTVVGTLSQRPMSPLSSPGRPPLAPTPRSGLPAPGQPLGAGALAAAYELPAESPLASLATEALPSFSPDKPAEAPPAASPAAATPASKWGAAFDSPAAPVAAAGPSAAAAATPRVTADGWQGLGSPYSRSSQPAAMPPPAGLPSSSAAAVREGSVAGWAAGLRPHEERLPPGAAGWNRGSTSDSPRPKPQRQPLSGNGSRAGSLSASPCKQQLRKDGHEEEAKQRQQEGSQQGQQAQQAQQVDEEDAGGGLQRGPLTVMVTRAVSKLAQLDLLQGELELRRVPPGVAAYAVTGGGGGASAGFSVSGQGQQRQQYQELSPGQAQLHQQPSHQQLHHTQHQQRYQQQPREPSLNPRRSLDLALSAIVEGLAGDTDDAAASGGGGDGGGGGGNGGGGGGRARDRPWRLSRGSPGSDVAASASKRRRRGGADPQLEGPQLGLLKEQQEQLEISLREMQRRQIDEGGVLQGLSTAAAASWQLPSRRAAGPLPTTAMPGQPQQACERSDDAAGGHRQHQRQEMHQEELLQLLLSSPASSNCSADEGRYPQRLSSPPPAAQVTTATVAAGDHEAPQPPAAALQQPVAPPLVVAVNPLFGGSRPGSAATQSMPGMLPAKLSLTRQRQPSSQEQQQQQQQEAMQPSPPLPPEHDKRSGSGLARRRTSAGHHTAAAPAQSSLASFGSLGSGFGVLRRESEDEVQQFLRGSLAVQQPPPPQQQQQQQPLQHAQQLQPQQQQAQEEQGGRIQAAQQTVSPPQLQSGARISNRDSDSGSCWPEPLQPAASADSLPGGTPMAAEAGAGGITSCVGTAGLAAAASFLSSIDLTAILDSRPASPCKLPPLPTVCGGIGSAVAGEACDEWQTARSGWQGWHTARIGTDGPGSACSSSSSTDASSADVAWPNGSTNGSTAGEAVPASLPAHVLPPGPPQHLAAAASPAGSGSLQGSASYSQQEEDEEQEEEEEGVLRQRAPSPELPGLGHSLRQAQMLQAAVGRLPGKLSASDAEGIQATLTDVLEQQATHVQAHYRQAALKRLARLRRRLAHDPAVLQRVLAQHVPTLEAAREAGARAEMTSFVEQVLPRLAEVLSSEGLLTRCLQAAGAEHGRALQA